MPPLLPGHTLSSAKQLSCSTTTISIRTVIKMTPFNTTKQPQNHIGPESPQYVRNLPVPPQSEPFRKPVVKGSLPVPRNIFPRRAGSKTSEAFLSATVPEPARKRRPADDFEIWKARMANSRRRNLREAVVDLQKRRVQKAVETAQLSQNRSYLREKALAKPIREDERLTNPTITTANSTLQKGILPDPNREARIAEKKARVAARAAAKEEARKDALHTLYMNARSFITTESELEAEIEAIFTDEPFEKGNMNDNIWLVHKAPPTVQELLNSVKGEERGAADYYGAERPSIITGKRVGKIAEELTGGKID